MRSVYWLLFGVAAALAQTPDGAAIFKLRCVSCHNGEATSRAPSLELMKPRTPESVLITLMTGSMRMQGSKLSGPERRAVAEFVTAKKLSGDVQGASTGRCAAIPAFAGLSGPSWNGWSPDVTNTRFQPAAQAGLRAATVPALKLKWAFGFPDAAVAWSQPAVVGGRVFVGSHNGTVYSLDALTGCVYWAFSAGGGVRTGLSIGSRAGGGFTAYFGDTSARVYAVDASSGRPLWSRQVEEHPLARVTGSPVLHYGRLYVPTASYEEAQGADPDYECCTFRGSVSALDAKTGAVIWKTYTIDVTPKVRGKSLKGATLWGPSGVAIWSAPTIDAKRGVLYAATGNTYSDPAQPNSDAVLALDLATGKIRWSKQVTPNDTFLSGCRAGSTNPNCPAASGPDHDFGNAPMLAKLPGGRELIVIGQKSGVGFAMDPDKQGAIVWQYRAGQGGALGGMEWGSAVDGEYAYFPVSDITRPQPGGLHAVHLATGERAWFTPAPPLKCAAGRGCNAAQPAAITAIPGIVFSGSNDGGLRAYSTKDGSIVWEFDTNREFQTVNGVAAKGASMQGPGPAVAGGMVFVNSGYGAFGGRPGNVLLAFGLE
jgi:polyvinyl alcohol dehydrogenase (cytochrome)